MATRERSEVGKDTRRALRFVRGCAVAFGLLAISRVSAQEAVLQGARSTGTTRAQLEEIAVVSERLAVAPELKAADRDAYRQAASRIRARLVDGDFQVGDQVTLQVQGQDSLTQSFTVREGLVLLLPSLPEISLHGVLRSELREYLTAQIGRYVRNPSIRATATVRVGVLGEVRNPGFYRVASDLPLSEAVMAAGGPSPDADLHRAVVRRNTVELLPNRGFSDALTSGATLDQLSVRAGDEIVIGQRRRRDWQLVLQSTAIVSSIWLALRVTRNR